MLLRGILRLIVRLARITASLTMALALLGLAALLLGPRAAGVQPLIVLTGSMEPTLEVGGLAFMRPLAAPLEGGPPAVDPSWQPTSSIRAGDIITFRPARNPAVTISHRVIAVAEDGGVRSFTTKGDAAARVDALPVPAANVVGTIVFHLPHLGRVADWLRHPRSFIVLVGVPTAAVLVTESLKIARDIRGGSARRRAPTVDASEQPYTQGPGGASRRVANA